MSIAKTRKIIYALEVRNSHKMEKKFYHWCPPYWKRKISLLIFTTESTPIEKMLPNAGYPKRFISQTVNSFLND